MWKNMETFRIQKISSATHNEKCVTVTKKKWRIIRPQFHSLWYSYTHDSFYTKLLKGEGSISYKMLTEQTEKWVPLFTHMLHWRLIKWTSITITIAS